MSEEDVEAQFRAAYTEEATRSAQSLTAAKDRPGAASWNEAIAKPLIDTAPTLAERLYSWAVSEAVRIEKQSGIRLKKGLEYCNLGAAQMHQRKVREAYRNFELAEREDIDHGDASHAGLDVIEGVLLLPAGDTLVDLVSQFAAATGSGPHLISKARGFWVRVYREDRLRLREVLPDCRDADGVTASVLNLRFHALEVIARLGEDVLRGKWARPGERCDMQCLLRREFGTRESSILFDDFKRTHGDVGPANVDGQMEAALTYTNDPLTNAMIVFYVARNYTAHWTRSSVECTKRPGLFEGVLRTLAAFLARIDVPEPPPCPLSEARLPFGVLAYPYEMSTPVNPELDKGPIRDWVTQVVARVTGAPPLEVVVAFVGGVMRLQLRLSEAAPDPSFLGRYLSGGLSVGGYFKVDVSIEP
jgi:hypothetical protein